MTTPPDAVRHPLGARAFAGIGALGVALYFGVLQPLSLEAAGLPWSAWLLVGVTAPLVAFLALLALSPSTLQRLLSRHTALDLRDGGHVAAAVVMACTFWLVIGYGSIVGGAAAIETVQAQGRETLREIDGTALFSGLVESIIVLTLPPFFYVAFVHGGGPHAALHRLGLRLEGAPRAAALGVAATFVLLLILLLVGLALQALPIPQQENERALAIARAITVLGAVGLSLGAAVSEEIFFRGFLQPRVGIWGQAALFGVAHLSYVSVSEVVVVTLLALAFGFLYRSTRNLAAPIAAHFTFNLLMLLAAIYGA